MWLEESEGQAYTRDDIERVAGTLHPVHMEQTHCPICTDAPTRVVGSRGILEKGGALRPFINVLCMRCGLVFMNPRPTPAEYRDLYATYETHRYGIDTQEASATHAADQAARLATARPLVDALHRYIKAPAVERRVLEVGCAYGFFSEAVKQSWGCRVQGVEPSVRFADVARARIGMSVFTGSFEEYAAQRPAEEQFDLIVLNHVFEHFPDPLATIRLLETMLAPGGVVYMEVPNTAHFKKPVDRFFDYCHPFSYSPASLARLLAVAAWKPIAQFSLKPLRLQVVVAPASHTAPAVVSRNGAGPRMLYVQFYFRRVIDRLRLLRKQ